MSFLLSHIFSSTKLEKRAEQVLPGSKRDWGESKRGVESRGRGSPNNVYTYK
jgi:hypothetical protein